MTTVAVIGASRGIGLELARQYAADGCRVHATTRTDAALPDTAVALHPGYVRTDMTGSHASLSPEDSVRGIRKLLAGLTAKDSGRFLDYRGKDVPW